MLISSINGDPYLLLFVYSYTLSPQLKTGKRDFFGFSDLQRNHLENLIFSTFYLDLKVEFNF